LIRVLRTRQIA